jgi:hypothetical protein
MCHLCRYGSECLPKLCAWTLAEISATQRRLYILSLLQEALGYITYDAKLIKKIEKVLEQEHRSVNKAYYLHQENANE